MAVTACGGEATDGRECEYDTAIACGERGVTICVEGHEVCCVAEDSDDCRGTLREGGADAGLGPA